MNMLNLEADRHTNLVTAGVTVEEQPRGVGSLIKQLLWLLGMN